MLFRSTGSGKSSLISLLPRFHEITAGSIFISGQDIRDYSFHDLRGRIGFVPQKALLFSGTVKENLLWGNEDASDDELRRAARIAQALRFIERKEGGFDFKIAQGGANLSGGQRQRLAIARALVRCPEILIFDDSFSALDLKTDKNLRTALQKEITDATFIIVAQRISTVADADKILVLNEGSLVGFGTHEELLENCDIYREILFSQQKEAVV